MDQNEMSEMPDYSKKREVKFNLLGWILFVVCAVLFMASSIRNHDIIALAASIVFLIACVVFMIPLLRMIIGGKT
jgi:membrane protein YdbS with pleckstrin-like domain